MEFKPTETVIIKRSAKIRSRHMIPMEMLAFLTLLMAGIAGAFPLGYLHYVLQEAEQAMAWGFALIPIALAGFVISTSEWVRGADWENGHLRHSIFWRQWASLIAFLMWFYTLWAMAGLRHGPVTSMVITACFVSPFHLWSWWVNMRVHTALNPKLKTDRLQKRLEFGRDRW